MMPIDLAAEIETNALGPGFIIPSLPMDQALRILASTHVKVRDGDEKIPFQVWQFVPPNTFPPGYMEAWATVLRHIGEMAPAVIGSGRL